jgi:hypothetical protein
VVVLTNIYCNMFRFLFIVTLFIVLQFQLTEAIFKEDAGVLDFRISSAGPVGPNGVAIALGELLITSDSSGELYTTKSTSCTIAARSLATGAVVWRRNVCGSPSKNKHVVTTSRDRVLTYDGSMVQAWAARSGQLVWDASFETTTDSSNIAIWTVDDLVVASSGQQQHTKVWNEATGQESNQAAPKKPPSKTNSQKLQASCGESTFSMDESRKNLVAFNTELNLQLSQDDSILAMHLVSCNNTGTTTLLLSSIRAVSTFVTCDNAQCKIPWTRHDGLASIDSGLLLDSSHVAHNEPDEALALLSVRARWMDQWSRLTRFTSTNDRNHVFGFYKTAVLLSSTAHRVYGVDTAGTARGDVRYTVDVPLFASWHRIVQGAPNSVHAAHGINGGTHARELLVMSAAFETKKELHWTCVDGTNGDVISTGTLKLSANVAQVIPLTSHSSSCRQGAMVLLNDGTILTAPDDGETKAAMELVIGSTENGFYTHTISKSRSTVESFMISSADSKPILAGSLTFAGEDIVTVAYPSRDEIIQSPCNVVGDNSLLLKYMNPHIGVVITTVKSNEVSVDSAIVTALEAANKDKKGKQKRKPTGVGKEEVAPTEREHQANLFVNVVDTVSGRILYRISHANALMSPTPSAVISENWIFYTFANKETRRAEIGVLSMYEGMIHSKGLTAFTRPEQSSTFSSLDQRDSKPVVLAKSYSIARPATAIAVTASRSGISTKRVIIAGVDGQIYTIDKKSLEPRRPLGQMKDHEKAEGLLQYAEFILTIPLLSLNYNQAVDNVKGIVTAPTDLESQTLVLAYGGPDIFFARTSPSRGFDLLPESFNRTLLSLVVAALLVLMVVANQRVSAKIRQAGWV